MVTTSDTRPNAPCVTFIGYGEAARAFVAGWAGGAAVRASAFDIKTDGDQRAAQLGLYAADGTTGHDTATEAVAAGDVVFSMVTADQALIAAQSAASAPLEGRLFLDCNSCAPQTKVLARDAIEAAGGRYVDVAVMAPVHPKLNRVPVLISGPHVAAAQAQMQALGMDVTLAEGPVGTASSIKLCRSIIVKGLEAISAEMLVSARSLGVERAVLESLDASYPGFDWVKRGSYALDRMLVHGNRRSSEMAETARMVAGLGLPAHMAAATAEWQQVMGALGVDPGADDLETRTDLVLGALKG